MDGLGNQISPSNDSNYLESLLIRPYRQSHLENGLDPGTLLDVANRAEKRGLVHSVDWLRDLKETRNPIAHDYSGERLTEVLSYCLTELSQLLEACTRTSSYGKKIQPEES